MIVRKRVLQGVVLALVADVVGDVVGREHRDHQHPDDDQPDREQHHPALADQLHEVLNYNAVGGELQRNWR